MNPADSTERSVGSAVGTVGSASSELCTQCGLCCMGIIHQVAVLDPDEIPRARENGLPVLPTERPLFSLPCPRLEGTICGIYGDRPNVCGRYKCQLLQNFEAGITRMDDAVSKVSEAKRLLSEVHAVLPKGMSYQQARKLAQSAEPRHADDDETALAKSEVMHLKLRAMALDLFIDRFFRNSRDRKSFELSAVDREMEKDG